MNYNAMFGATRVRFIAIIVILLVSSLDSHGATATSKTCEGLFVAKRAARKTVAAESDESETTEKNSPAKKAKIPVVKPATVDVITSVNSGNQIYQIVIGEKGQTSADGDAVGIYRRANRSWKMVVEGEVQTDPRGQPTMVQLNLSRTDDKAYVVTVVDGQIYLLSNLSNIEKPSTFVRFGSTADPLLEVGSTQKRFLAALSKQSKVSIYQDQTISSSGGQTVLVSVKFDRPESSGEGMTFAFEVLPSDSSGAIRLNGSPVVLDYDYHTQPALANLIYHGGQRGKETIVYSKILIERLAGTDLTSFGDQITHVKKLLTDYVNSAIRAVKPGAFLESSESTVGYNMTMAKTIRDVALEKEIFADGVFSFTQNYFAGEKPLLKIVNNENGGEFELSGVLDMLPNKKPAVWRNQEQEGTVLFMKDRSLFISFVDEFGEAGTLLADLGEINSLFSFARLGDDIPAVIDYTVIHPRGTSNLEKAVVLLSVQTKGGNKFTAAVRLNLFLRNLLKVETVFKLTNFKMTSEELKARTDLGESEALDEDSDAEEAPFPSATADVPASPLFDDLTPAKKSISAYEQAYDPSRPHIDLFASTNVRTAHVFKRPTSTVSFAPGLSYAHFSLTKGILDPSGIYVGVEASKITGNESTRVTGEIVPHPFIKKDLPENEEYRRFIFADIAAPRLGDPAADVADSTSEHHVYLMAVDAARAKGANGYVFVLALPDKKGAYSLMPIQLPRGVTASIGDFKDANFIRGRKGNQSTLFLLLAFKGKGPKGVETTFSVKLSLVDEKYETEIVKVEDRPITAADLGRNLGFTDDGAPCIVLTPDLAQEAHQFAIFDLKSGARVFPNQNYGGGENPHKGMKFGDFKGGVANFQNFLRSEDSWAVSSAEVKKRYSNLGRSRELAQFDSFVELGRQLDEMTNPKSSATRLLLVVPEALRELVWDFVLSRALSEKVEDGTDRFNFKNRALNLQLISKSRSAQVQYLANLDLWTKMSRTEPNERNFLVTRVDEIVGWAAEKSEDEAEAPAFKIREIGAGTSTDLAPMSTSRLDRVPHPLYLLAAGRPLSLKEFRNEKPKPDASMLVIATPEEMKAMEEKAGAEVEHGMLDSFKIQEIKDPDHESMALSLTSIFAHPDVKSLGYKFSANKIKEGKDFESAESFDIVVDYAISRFAYFVAEKKEPLFEAFMRFRAAFANSVLTDKEARRSRVLDKHFVERVLTKVFDIPMNLQTLPADDPMRLLSEQRALLKWQEAGYAGPFDLKAAIRDTIVSQTRADAGKPIPSSVMLFGNTGAGKTYAFKTLVKMLQLKMYDFNAADNSEAQAIILNVGQLLESGGQNREGNMDVQQAIAHLEKFLSGPNGYRGWILIDDVHAAKDPVKAKVVSWLRGIFESQDGMYSFEESGTRRPIRNLNIFLTLNPTADQDQIAKYSKKKNAPTSEEILLATLSTSEFKVEPSFLRRWGRIVNLDYMPAGAKGPELINSMARASNSLLNMHNMIALVDPSVIKMLVTNNSQVDARTFLSASTSALIEAASPDPAAPTTAKQSAVVMVVPSLTKRVPRDPHLLEENPGEEISRSVRQGTRTLALDSGLEGKLTFLRMIVDAFRIPVYESFVLALQEDPRFSGDTTAQKMFLAPVLTAMIHHLQDHPHVTVNDLGVTASDFEMRTPNERELFRSTIERIASTDEALNLPELPLRDRLGTSWQDVLGDTAAPAARNRADVLGHAMTQNRQAIAERLIQILRVSDLDAMPEPGPWLSGLAPKTELDPKQVGRLLAENLWNYLPEIFAPEVNRNYETSLSTYSATRLFLQSIDRSVLKMPWMSSSRFLLKSLEMITKDQVLSQKPGVQNFLFSDRYRLVKPTITDFVFQIIASSHAAEDVPADIKKREKTEFDSLGGVLLNESPRR